MRHQAELLLLAALAGVLSGCPGYPGDCYDDSCGSEAGDGDGDADGDADADCDADCDADADEYESFWAEVHLHNAAPDDAFIQIRTLRSSVDLDCYELSKAPGSLLPAAAFREGVSWKLPGWTNVSAGLIGHKRLCHAAIVSGQSVEPTLLFWEAHDVPGSLVPGQYFAGDTPRVGAVRMIRDADEFIEYEDLGGTWHHDIVAPTSPPPECASPGDGGRLAWDAFGALGTFQLLDVFWGPDNCAQLTTWTLEDFSAEDPQAKQHYLCMEPSLFPLQAGDWFETSAAQGSAVEGEYSGFLIRRLDDGLQPTQPQTELILSHLGGGIPEIAGLEFVVRESFGCDFVRDELCAETSRALYLQTLNLPETVDLTPGAQPASISPEPGVEVTMQLAYARRRILVDTDCAEGSARIGDDLEIAALIVREQGQQP